GGGNLTVQNGASITAENGTHIHNGTTGLTINNSYTLPKESGASGQILKLNGSNLEWTNSGDYIPLSGTEVGKPLTGNIEVDTTNDRVGFYSEDGNNERFIGLSDDGFNYIITSNSSWGSYLEQSSSQNWLGSQNNNNQVSSI